MRQLLLLILLFVVGQWFVKTLRRAQSAARPGEGDAGGGAGTAGGTARARSAGSRGAAAPASLPEPMVRCAECGVHAPKSESPVVAGQPFCCDEHARRYAARMAGSDTAAR